ncbi:LOW QUALITY PROTEIN: hypothetical protein HID58_082096, partial [Brassica napus]
YGSPSSSTISHSLIAIRKLSLCTFLIQRRIDQFVYVLVFYFVYLAVAGEILPGKLISGSFYQMAHSFVTDAMLFLRDYLSSKDYFQVTFVLYITTGRSSSDKSSSLKPHVSGNLMRHHCREVGLHASVWRSPVDSFHFTFSIQACNCGWWLLHYKVELTVPAIVANCFVFLIGGVNKQKHISKNPKTPIWVVNNAKVVLKILRGNRKHCSYLGDLMLAPSFSLPCGISNLFCLSSSSYKYQI